MEHGRNTDMQMHIFYCFSEAYVTLHLCKRTAVEEKGVHESNDLQKLYLVQTKHRLRCPIWGRLKSSSREQQNAG